MSNLAEWIIRKFTRQPDEAEVIFNACIATFGTPDGQIYLQHLVNNVYATVCYSKDPIEIAAHNARRSVVHEILETLYLKETHGRSEQ